MAEENIILKVGIDQKQVQDAIKSAADARKEIDRLREANKALAKAEGDNSVAIAKNNIEIKQNSAIVRENERIVIANSKAQDSNKGSIEQLRAQLSVVTNQWNKLSEEERGNTEAGKALSKQKLDLTNKLKAEEKATGDTRRNVGNYTESIIEAGRQTGLFGGVIGKVQQVQAVYTTTLKTATVATSSFKKALISTGIGALLVLLGSLVSFLTSTQEGLDKVSQAFAGVQTFVGTFIDALSNLGKQIFDSIVPAFKALGTIIKGVVTFDLKTLKQGFQEVQDAVSGIEPISIREIGKQAIEAAKEAARLKKEIQEINIAEANLNVERAKSRALINELRQASQDENRELEERERLLRQAIGIEQQQINQAIELANRRLENLKAEKALTNSLETDNQEIRDLEIQIAKLQEESLNKQIELQGQLRGIEAKREQERNARQQASLKAIEDEINDRERLEAEEIERQRQINEALELEQIERGKRLTKAAIIELQEQFAQGLISKEQYEQSLTDIEAGALAIRKINAEIAIEEANNNLLISEAERIRIITEAENEILAVKQATTDQAVALRQKELEAEKKKAEDQVKLNEDVANAKLQLTNFVFDQVVEALGRESIAGKLLASFQAGINTAQGVTKALASSAPPLNFINAALVGAQGLAQVAKINSAQTPNISAGASRGGGSSASRVPTARRTFARGGFTGDGYGSPDETGFKQAGIVHENEYVVPAWQVQSPKFSPLISSLESSRLKGYADGGFVGRSALSTNQTNNVESILDAIRNMPAPVVAVSDIETKANQRNKVRVESRLDG